MDPIKALNLTNLGIDCLERIFRYLPLPDLMNVADSNKQLKKVAELAFLLEFQHYNQVVAVVGFTSCPKMFYYSKNSNGNILSANSKKTFQLLRCFGHLVSRMRISMNLEYVDNNKLLDVFFGRLIFYVKEYCVESLTELVILGKPGGSLNSFEKPFPNVHTVCIQATDTTNVSLIELFPKMRRLTYHCDKIAEIVSIERDLLAIDLEHFEVIAMDTWEQDKSFRKIRLSQLRSLTIPFNAIFEGFNDFFPHLEKLKLNDNCRKNEFINVSPKCHFKTVKILEIINRSLSVNVPLSFDNLEELDLHFESKLCYEHFYDWVSKFPTILKLKIRSVCMLDLSRLKDILPLLEEFECTSDTFSIHEVFSFIKAKKNLKKIEINIKDQEYSDISDVKRSLGLNAKWHGEKSKYQKYKFTLISM